MAQWIAKMPNPDDNPATRLRLRAQTVKAVQRDGFIEFRCTPSTWSYADARPFDALISEYYSERKAVDPKGAGVDRNFWSGSDAALRLRQIAPDDLAVREMTALATRRSVGLNAPKPWVAWDHVIDRARAWEVDADDIHWTEQLPRDDSRADAWSHYGMTAQRANTVVYGWGMTGHAPPPGAGVAAMRRGGPGRFHRWSQVHGWSLWPRRQDLPAAKSTPSAEVGVLRLFVSHRWDTTVHPDPDGAQLLALKVGLTLALARALTVHTVPAGQRTSSGLPEVMAAHLHACKPGHMTDPKMLAWATAVEKAARNALDETELWPALQGLEDATVAPMLADIRQSIGLWYDYASMHQAPRSVKQERHFRAEIVRLNQIQASACTLVLTGGADYVGRAWCFLELCGGMRGTIVELTPTWGRSIAAAESLIRWGSRSDQLIGALNTLGHGAICTSGLRATHDDDLPIVARLLADLPLTGRVETDDSDLVGGAIPHPRLAGGWVMHQVPEPAPRVVPSAALDAPGRVAGPMALRKAMRHLNALDRLAGRAALWVYTTQRALSLSWAARRDEIWAALQPALLNWQSELGPAAQLDTLRPDLACCWADARALGDDGQGWTRIVSSESALLVIVTQPEVPPICRIYDRVLRAHLAAGVPVLTYAPTTGTTLLHLPPAAAAPAPALPAHVLAVPRIRRSQAYLRYQLLPASTTADQVSVLAALRLEPPEGFVQTGDTVRPPLSATTDGPPINVTTQWLLSHARQRARVEGLARSVSASWDTWCAPRLQPDAWAVAVAPHQLELMEALVRASMPVSDNPMRRRKLIYVVVEDEAGYALPPHLVDDMSELVRRILKDQPPGG